MKLDLQGKNLSVGDIIVVGADNGSRLTIAVIYKLTPKLVHFKYAVDSYTCRGNRRYDRVVKLWKVYMKAWYRKMNDRSLNSSTYHKKDGTPVRAILKRMLMKEKF